MIRSPLARRLTRSAFPWGLPAGAAGETVTVSATGATGGHEASTANNTGQATLRYFAGVADLDLTRMTTHTESVIVGETISVAVDVQNAGTASAGNVTVTIPLPTGLTRDSEYAEGWDCALVDRRGDRPVVVAVYEGIARCRRGRRHHLRQREGLGWQPG